MTNLQLQLFLDQQQQQNQQIQNQQIQNQQMHQQRNNEMLKQIVQSNTTQQGNQVLISNSFSHYHLLLTFVVVCYCFIKILCPKWMDLESFGKNEQDTIGFYLVYGGKPKLFNLTTNENDMCPNVWNRHPNENDKHPNVWTGGPNTFYVCLCLRLYRRAKHFLYVSCTMYTYI